MEYIVFWIIAGIIGDVMFHQWLSAKEKAKWKKFAITHNIKEWHMPECSLLISMKQAPWWVHLIMILIPPTVIGAFSVFEDY